MQAWSPFPFKMEDCSSVVFGQMESAPFWRQEIETSHRGLIFLFSNLTTAPNLESQCDFLDIP
jgi:hypothetical protein